MLSPVEVHLDQFQLRKCLLRKNTNISYVIIFVLSSKEFQESKLKIAGMVDKEFPHRGSIKTSYVNAVFFFVQ